MAVRRDKKEYYNNICKDTEGRHRYQKRKNFFPKELQTQEEALNAHWCSRERYQQIDGKRFQGNQIRMGREY